MTEQAITFITDDNVELEGRVAYNDKSKICYYPSSRPWSMGVIWIIL